jgi:RNA polymerase sigma factor (sigma-70 family)
MAPKPFAIPVALAPGAAPRRAESGRPAAAAADLTCGDERPGPGGGAVSAGAASRLEQLFRLQGPRLMRYLSRRTGGRDDAADLVQESFLRLIRATAEQDFPQRPEAYLQRIARNLLLNRARQALARSEHLHIPADDDTLAAQAADPEQTLQYRQLAARYERALQALSPKTQNVFLRHRRDGYSYAQIAEELGQSVSNVEKHMMKAIAHFDRVLGRPE